MKYLAVLFSLAFLSCSPAEASEADSLLAAVNPWELPWMNGEGTYSSDDHPDAVFVIENYFNGCSYCNTNAPKVDSLAEHYRDNPRVQVLDIGIDRNDRDYQRWIANHSPNHPVLKDANREISGQLGVSGYPTAVILNCSREVVFRTTGVWSASTIEQMKQIIDQNLFMSCRF